MKRGISIRYQQVGDAKRFFEILNNPNFLYFPAKPKTIEAEKEFLRKNAATAKRASAGKKLQLGNQYIDCYVYSKVRA